jgi:hypothetical protein
LEALEKFTSDWCEHNKNLQSRLTDIIDLLSYGYKIQAANQGAIQGEAVQEQAQQ